jgi:hypothetical protein
MTDADEQARWERELGRKLDEAILAATEIKVYLECLFLHLAGWMIALVGMLAVIHLTECVGRP